MLKFLKELFSQNTESNKLDNDAVWNLKCSICGHLYRVGEDATIVTMDDVFESAGSVIMFGSGNSIQKDLVASMEGWPADRLKDGQRSARKNMQRIRKTLDSGQARYWYCKACGNEDNPSKYR